MTDLPATAPITSRSFSLPRPGAPRLGIGALLIAVFSSIGDAIKLAYVTPYISRHRRPQAAPDDDLNGRDPSW